jgi:hypothetical protein
LLGWLILVTVVVGVACEVFGVAVGLRDPDEAPVLLTFIIVLCKINDFALQVVGLQNMLVFSSLTGGVTT